MASNNRLTNHYKCRNAIYPRDNIKRFDVPDDKVPWNVPFPEYRPPEYTAASVRSNPSWADKDMTEELSKTIAWNNIDKSCRVDRRSFYGRYKLDKGVPLNIIGRTGLKGRGTLGRYGPNHAADPIVTRWKRDAHDKISADPSTGKKILQFVAIRRRDGNEWAIPGGMVDPDENITQTLRREFGEEALNSLEASATGKRQIEKDVSDLFEHGTPIYEGYVDDPRNTDNAWMETVAYNFHDEYGKSVGRFELHAGDDAIGAQWMDISRNLSLYASHYYMIKMVADKHQAHW